MFFATNAPSSLPRHAYSAGGRSLERFLEETRRASHQKSSALAQDDKSYTLTLDVPGIAKDQLSIGIEGSIVRIETREGAPRQYRQAYELPQDIDLATSEARLEHGVLTLKLGKLVPVSRVSELTVN